MSIFKRYEFLTVGFILLVCAVIFTLPLGLHLTTAAPVGIEPESVVMTQLFAVQWTGAALEQGMSYWDPPVFYPYKGAFSWCEPEPLFCYLVWFISKLLGYVCAYNVIILIFLALFGLIGYATARLLTDDRIASIWCGIWLTGGAYSLTQLSEPAILAAGFPTACVLFGLLYIRDRKPVFFCMAVLACISSWFAGKQLAFYITIMLPFVLAVNLYKRQFRVSYIIMPIVALAVTLVLVLPYALSQYSNIKPMGFGWAPRDFSLFSLHLEPLFLPATGHWLIRRILDHRWYSIGIGIIPLSVIAISLILGISRSRIEDQFRKRSIAGLLVMAVLALFIAFVPVLNVRFIRIPVRAVVFAIFSVSVLAAFALAYVRCRVKNTLMKRALTTVFFILLFAEMYAVPVTLFYPNSEIVEHAGAVNWLASREDGLAVLEFPLPSTYRSSDMKIEAGAQLRMLKHKHPIINGYATFEPTSHKQLRNALRNDPTGRGRRYLEAYGVGYVLVHKPALTFDQRKDVERMFAGKPVYDDAKHVIYSLPKEKPYEGAIDFLPISADFERSKPQKNYPYGVPLPKPVSGAILVKPQQNRYIECRWIDSVGRAMSKKVLIRGCVLLDAGQTKLYLRILKFPRGAGQGEAKLISPEEIGR